MRKKTALAMALLHNPKTLFLDEPFEGIDPVSSEHIRNLLIRLVQKGVTVFITSHILDIVQSIVEEFAILSSGRIVHSGRMAEIIASGSSLKDVYFRYDIRSEADEIAWLGY